MARSTVPGGEDRAAPAAGVRPGALFGHSVACNRIVRTRQGGQTGMSGICEGRVVVVTGGG
ncbi:MAG: hypothetical protein ACRDYY_07055, partial [Acidimicrobiales bacterium]